MSESSAPEASPPRGGRRARLVAGLIAAVCLGCCIGPIGGVRAWRWIRNDFLYPPVWEWSMRLETPGGAPTEQQLEDATAVVARRLEALGIPGRVAPSGLERLAIGLPEMSEQERADVRTILTKTGLLELKIVVTPDSPRHRLPEAEIERLIVQVVEAKRAGDYDPASATHDVALYEHHEPDPATGELVKVSERRLLLLNDDANALIPEFADVYRAQDSYGAASVGFTLEPASGDRFHALTSANVREQLAIVLDGKVKSYPVLRSAIRRQAIIELGPPPAVTGQASSREEEVKRLLVILKAGGLPGRLIFESEKAISGGE